LHMYCGYQNHTLLEEGVSGESAEAGSMAFRQRRQWISRDAGYDEYVVIHYTVFGR